MHTPKIIISIATITVLFVGQTFAQQYSSNPVPSNGGQQQPMNQGQPNYQGQPNPQPSPEDKAQRTAKHLQKKLGLSPDQANQVYNLTLAHEQEKARYENSIVGLLNPQQQQTYSQMRADEQAKRDAQRQQNGNNAGSGYNDPYNGGQNPK